MTRGLVAAVTLAGALALSACSAGGDNDAACEAGWGSVEDVSRLWTSRPAQVPLAEPRSTWKAIAESATEFGETLDTGGQEYREVAEPVSVNLQGFSDAASKLLDGGSERSFDVVSAELLQSLRGFEKFCGPGAIDF